MIRSEDVKPCNALKVFDAADVISAFKYLALGTRMGKAVLSFEDPHGILQVLPRKYAMQFSPRKTYLMVGCLGCLGRSITKWIFGQGGTQFCVPQSLWVIKTYTTRLGGGPARPRGKCPNY